VPLPHVAEYYQQRANTPGSLLITEATFIAARAGGHKHAPGIWSDEQIAAWKKVRLSGFFNLTRWLIRDRQITDAVHAKGSYIYLQLWALGRAAEAAVLEEEGLSDAYVSASNVPIAGQPVPRPLTVEEIQEYVQLYATAASNAVHKAGFDGVDIHAANGYLLDQFLHDRSNIQTDAYGGSVENRTRFPLEVVEAVVNAVGEKKTAFRISPWGTYLGMLCYFSFRPDPDILPDMHFDHPKPTYTHLVTQLCDRYPELAYLHVVEPRVDGSETLDIIKDGYSNDFIRDIWGDRRLISAGGYTRETAIAAAEEKGDLIAFARPYVANVSLFLLFY
jgi:NADPH2 dehydrogenase